jgi:imidazolonepropionase-like amidohydrolase
MRTHCHHEPPNGGKLREGSVVRCRRMLLVAAFLLPSILTAQTVAITGGKVYPVTGPPIENATVLIVDGRIAGVGANINIPQAARRIDARGKWVTPGLVNASSQIGVNEIGLSAGYVDAGARGAEGIAAAFRVWEGFNPATAFLPPVRKDGITTIGVLPNRGMVQGQAAALDMLDGTVSEMVLKAPVAMVGDFSNVSGVAGARGELVARWRELLGDARVYRVRRTQYESNQSRAFAASRADLEALGPVVAGTMPLWLIADRASDIEAALGLAKEFSLRIAILGGAESWMVADKLAAAKVPVLVGAMNNIPGSFNTLGMRQETPGLLRARGVHVVLISNGAGDAGTYNAGNLRYDAGNAVAYGMTWNDALRAATLSAAEALGVADKVGSLTIGKMGNVVVWSGDPFEFASVPEHVLVHGAEFTRPTRDEELTNRYKTQPPTYRRPPGAR